MRFFAFSGFSFFTSILLAFSYSSFGKAFGGGTALAGVLLVHGECFDFVRFAIDIPYDR